MVELQKESPSIRLLKHIIRSACSALISPIFIRCYLRLSENDRGREALRVCLPDSLKDSTFFPTLKEDPGTRK